ncbi:MAG TPA: molybdopterin-dependent oxidoreductase [Cyclobacteriaceae bacterium]|nr:molybdopterin-dependent oxidoreductase [Cyclobacteriaceae bacterium]HRK52634.1 molybdopterin-dependent oxidoreductase [Cyclobacteriaceae bacterium]
MKNSVIVLLVFLIAFTFGSCNNSKTSEQKENEAISTKASLTANVNNSVKDASHADNVKYISKEVEVKGDVEFPFTFTVDALKKMNVVTIEDFVVVCQSGSEVKENKSSKGVLLKDILEKAKIIQTNHKDRNFYIVARATDNYMATFSWAEIFNNPTGENVYIIFEENGIPIKNQGDMILICKNDIKTGPRHVTWLKSIEIKRVN